MNADIISLQANRKALEKQLTEVSNQIRDIRANCNHVWVEVVNQVNENTTQRYVHCENCGTVMQ